MKYKRILYAIFHLLAGSQHTILPTIIIISL